METNQEEGGAQKLQTEEKTKWVIQTAQREREREREREEEGEKVEKKKWAEQAREKYSSRRESRGIWWRARQVFPLSLAEVCNQAEFVSSPELAATPG